MNDFVPLSDADQALLAKDHPDFDVTTIPAIPAGFTYDAGFPSLFPRWVKGEGDLRLALWINHLKPEDRETPESNRYLLFVDDDRCICLASNEDWEDVAARARFSSAILNNLEPQAVDAKVVRNTPEFRSYLESLRRDALPKAASSTRSPSPSA